ncbi:MAG: hypothetical protein H0T78_06030 [Longispora sp.]|nr:hypothetical protein [Longispora sp. (in: high G+C Gram-positive bacteria)]
MRRRNPHKNRTPFPEWLLDLPTELVPDLDARRLAAGWGTVTYFRARVTHRLAAVTEHWESLTEKEQEKALAPGARRRSVLTDFHSASFMFGPVVANILVDALRALPDLEARAERHCRDGEHGVLAIRTDRQVAFFWGEDLLAVVFADQFDERAQFRPIPGQLEE